MLFINTQSKGKDAGFPDPCKTPPNGLPIPYPNFVKGSAATPSQNKFLVKGKPVHNLKTKKKKTNGDEPGKLRGLISQSVKSKHKHTKGSSKFYVKKSKCTRLSSPGMGNKINCPMHAKVSPDQTKYIVLS